MNFTENIILAEQKSPLKSTRKKPSSILAENLLEKREKKPRHKDDKAQKCSLCTNISSDKAFENHVNNFHSEYCCQKCKEIVDIPSNHLCEHHNACVLTDILRTGWIQVTVIFI